MDVALALDYLVPGAKRGGSLTDNTPEAYEGLRWEDERRKPEWEEILSAWAAIELTNAREDFKSGRHDAVSAITVEVDGLVFDGDETSQNRMVRAITCLLDDETTQWVLHDNTVVDVDKSTLTKALRLAGKRQTDLWIMPKE